MPGREEANSGFSLVEMLVVISIFSLLVVTAANYRRPGNTYELRAFVLKLTSELQRARRTATSTAHEAVVTFEEGNRSYEAEDRKVKIPEAITVTSKPTVPFAAASLGLRIIFYPDGSSTGGKIVLRSRDRSETIMIDAITGAVQVAR